MNYFDTLSVEELQSYLSDFHKDYFGCRPRSATRAQWDSREWLTTMINCIHGEIERMKLTFEGREELRINGWVVEETDPELTKHAKWLADERERKQQEMENFFSKEYA